MDKLKSVAAFVAAVKSDSFSAEAAVLGVTPKLIAKQVNLESQLGLKLITQTTRRQSLTAVGREHYLRCKRYPE